MVFLAICCEKVGRQSSAFCLPPLAPKFSWCGLPISLSCHLVHNCGAAQPNAAEEEKPGEVGEDTIEMPALVVEVGVF